MTPPTEPKPAPPAAPKQENLLVSIICNIVIPAVVLGNLSGPNRLGTAGGLIVALIFPVGYGLHDFYRRRKANFISVISFVGVLLTGGLGLLKLGGFWFAVKDAAVSSVIGIAVLASVRAREPLVKTLFCNETVMDLPRVEGALRDRGTEAAFQGLLRRCTLIVASAFFVSAVLGYSLARYLLRSPAGTEAFNAELAKMHWLSWPVIVVPCMVLMMVALWRLVVGLKSLTGLTTDEIFKSEPAKAETGKPES
ncbi:MAG TPA: VC0807 family protein [Opitutaceae bacterium]|nr:VC0807 family protein [Opitutaceae bacterium]HND59951.1 VC0807 family protein [Opitutaceae bacterium]